MFLFDANADLFLDCALAVRRSNVSSSLKREAKRMKASALRFLKKRSTIEYQRYRKDLLPLDG